MGGGKRYGSGRKRKPTALRLLADNPSGRPMNQNEPQPEIYTAIPKPPRTLRGYAALEWKRRAKEMLDLGLLATTDTAAFELYCSAYGRYCEASKKLRKGMLQPAANGMLVRSPYLGILRDAIQEMMKLLPEFGMTPSSRSRIQVKRNRTAGPATPATESMESLEEKYLN